MKRSAMLVSFTLIFLVSTIIVVPLFILPWTAGGKASWKQLKI